MQERTNERKKIRMGGEWMEGWIPMDGCQWMPMTVNKSILYSTVVISYAPLHREWINIAVVYLSLF